MKIKGWQALLFLIVIVLAGGMAVLFLPHDYPVKPMSPRPGIKTWKLGTGSVIAYTHVPAKGSKKPYPLIYLHGGPGAGITDLEIKTLSTLSYDGYDVYLYDQAGCGHSGRLNDISEYTAERHKKDLEDIVRQLNAGKVILLAQSWGSILSLLFVADNPEKVDRIIVTAPANIQPVLHELANVSAPDSIKSTAPAPTNRASLVRGNLRARIAIYLVKKYGWRLMNDEEADRLQTYLTNELNKAMVCDTANSVTAESTEGFYVHYMTLKSLEHLKDPRPVLKKTPVPVYVMKGECDAQKWGFTSEYLNLFPENALTVIPGAGHNIFIEQPEKYLEAIRVFLNN